MRRKAFEAEVKAAGNTDAGEFTALVSVFNNVDHVGDRVLPGAFTKTLERWRTSNDPVPVILSHNWDDPFASLGVANPQDIKQTPQGLLVKGTLDINDNDVARQVYKLMKRRSLKAFSFGYLVPDGGEHLAEGGVNELSEVDLVEIGPTLQGANPEAQLQAVKSALAEEPRDEATLRKQADRLERDAQGEKLPPAKAAPDRAALIAQAMALAHRLYPDGVPQSVTSAILKDPQAYIDANKDKSAPKPEPQDEKSLRKQTDHLQREAQRDELPDAQQSAEGEKATRELLAEAVRDEVKAAVGEVLAELPRPEPADEATQRKALDKTEREKVAEDLPKAKQTPADSLKKAGISCQDYIAAESDPEAAAVMRDVLDTLKALAVHGNSDRALMLMELIGYKQGILKSVWTTAVINDLPDASFLFIESGGERDDQGKTTPRELRHFPYKDADGMVDVPHLRNALQRIPQSNLPQDVKDRLTQKAQTILDNAKSVGGEGKLEVVQRLAADEKTLAINEDRGDEEPKPAKSARQVDPLRRRSDETVLDISSDGVSQRKSPKKVKAKPKPEPAEERDLRRQSRDLMLELLSE